MKSQIRVRKVNGKIDVVEDGAFVEICDGDGTVAAVVFRTNKGEIKLIMPNDVEDQKYYARLFDVKFCKTSYEIEQEVINTVSK